MYGMSQVKELDDQGVMQAVFDLFEELADCEDIAKVGE